MKIGVFVYNSKQLDNWQLRILDGIVNDPTLELVLLIEGGQEIDWRLNNSLEGGHTFAGASHLLLKAQLYLEKEYLFKSKGSIIESELGVVLNNIPTIQVQPVIDKKGSIFAPLEINLIQGYELDLLLNLGSGKIVGEMPNVAKYGTWTLVLKDYLEKRSGPVGFWEVHKKKPVIGATLLKTTSTTQETEILDTAFFNRHWSITETATTVAEGSVSLLFKNLVKLKDQYFVTSKESIVSLPKDIGPKPLEVLQYIFGFYGQFFNRLVEKFMARYFKRRYECWTIFTGDTGFFDDITSGSFPLRMPDDEFWADPFLHTYKGVDYLFFENYSYITKRGKISCGILTDTELTDIVDVLDFKYHLSFPFLFEENGEIFLMPESSENKKLQIYRAVDFPLRWELYSTAFEGELVADAFIHVDTDKQKWLFLNKQASATAPMNSELFIYQIDSLKFNSVIPHRQNPVIIDAKVARNGGSIFKHDGDFYRPSQRNIDGIYGRALNINKIEKLTISEYVENTVKIIAPTFDKKLMGLHHLHQCGGRFVFDAAYRTRK
ncbi:hypothetical protein ACNR9Q_07320 [Maribacter sp. X9]|uniref:glucosamine inositolphosphorylceramide transferase family protein n=1 Tax=Maribacter sp. X9 TaxID=3402159 RepID=UPI003AF3C73B